jgi:hypothetical protein
MKKACIIYILAVNLLTGPVQKKITNGLIQATLYMPDSVNGYYRGTRFDWSGVIANLQWNGHSYFGQWFDKYDATKHDAIVGPVEAFDPIGFDEAKPGESFIKIGVGALIKPNDSGYNFLRYYPVSNYGKWKVSAKSNEVQFVHTLQKDPYGYTYNKTVALTKNKAQLVLIHTLKNTGSKRIETQVYNHNFFVIDNQPTGPGFVVKFPPEITANNSNEVVQFNANELIFLKAPGRRNVFFQNLTRGKGAGYELKIENKKTGAGVKITADRPMAKLVFWAASKTICPEPYIDIRLDPGEEFSWNIVYDFYTTSK